MGWELDLPTLYLLVFFVIVLLQNEIKQTQTKQIAVPHKHQPNKQILPKTYLTKEREELGQRIGGVETGICRIYLRGEEGRNPLVSLLAPDSL